MGIPTDLLQGIFHCLVVAHCEGVALHFDLFLHPSETNEGTNSRMYSIFVKLVTAGSRVRLKAPYAQPEVKCFSITISFASCQSPEILWCSPIFTY